MSPRNTRRAAWSRERGKHARDQLIAATAAIVLSQTGVVVGLLVAVQPELRDLRGISRDHTLVVKQSAEIRGELSDLVGRIARGVAHGATPPDLEEAVAHVRSAVATMSPLVDTAREQELFARLSRALDGFESSARQLARRDTGTAPAAEELLAEIRARTAEAAEAAQALVAFNADQVRSASDGIRVAILRMTVVSVLAAALGTAAALVLLRMGWAGLARHEAEREARRAELDAFAGRVAHELRTPLQTIDLSLAAVEGSTSRPEIVDRARSSVRSLDRTLRGLLEFSRAGGLAPEVAAHVFEPYVRGSGHPDGYGLGLATVKRLVEAHGGELRVESAPGQGLAIRFELPVPAAAPPQQARAPEG